MPLWKYTDDDEADVCKSCPLVATKPEAIEARLVPFIAMAIDLAEVRAIGGRFAYPDALSVIEWAVLRSLQRGQDKAKQLSDQRDAKKKKNG